MVYIWPWCTITSSHLWVCQDLLNQGRLKIGLAESRLAEPRLVKSRLAKSRLVKIGLAQCNEGWLNRGWFRLVCCRIKVGKLFWLCILWPPIPTITYLLFSIEGEAGLSWLGHILIQSNEQTKGYFKTCLSLEWCFLPLTPIRHQRLTHGSCNHNLRSLSFEIVVSELWQRKM